MSAKRSRKPLAKCNSNIQPPAKKAKHKSPRKASNLIDATEPILHDPAAFQPIQGAEHPTKSRVPEETSLTPAAFFGLFWDDSIIEHLVCATNAYAREKKATKQQWRYPISLSELRIFLGITILMGITRLGQVSRYWSDGILSVRSSMSYHRYCQVKRFIYISMPEDTTSLPHQQKFLVASWASCAFDACDAKDVNWRSGCRLTSGLRCDAMHLPTNSSGSARKHQDAPPNL